MSCSIWTAPCSTAISTTFFSKKSFRDAMRSSMRWRFEDARDRLMTMYRSVEGELAWTDLHYWTERVEMDVVAMHRELDHMIAISARCRRIFAVPAPIGQTGDDFDERPSRRGKRQNSQNRAGPDKWIASWTPSKSDGSRCDRNIGRAAAGSSALIPRKPSTSMTMSNAWRRPNTSESAEYFIVQSRVLRPLPSPRRVLTPLKVSRRSCPGELNAIG